jgi:Tfp pilus assembly protein PilF
MTLGDVGSVNAALLSARRESEASSVAVVNIWLARFGYCEYWVGVVTVRTRLFIVAFSTLALGGCQTFENAAQQDDQIVTGSASPTPTVQDPGDVKYFRSDEPLKLGLEHFNRGHFGLAQRYFQDAVEKAPKDVTAWVGLAASYDRIGRFDLADRAYASATRLVGETPEILNNIGYSYMLRGKLESARKKFQRAYAMDPGNPKIANNLQLLDSSYRFIQRSVDP